MTRTDVLFFAGIKHSGKTTMARLCAQRWGIPYHDSDDILTESIRPDYPDVRTFYRQAGAERFKVQEAKALEDFLDGMATDGTLASAPVSTRAMHDEGNRTATTVPRMIIALGGGACDNKELMDIVRRNGTSCYLANDPKVLLRRILLHGVPPFLDADDIEGSFAKLYARRDGLYRSICDFVIQLPDCEYPEDTCSFLLESLEKAMEVRG